MKNFESFVNEIVNQWRSEKKKIYENAGLSGDSNRETGDSAEDYIVSKVAKISPNYTAVKSKGSQTPSDIFAVANRGKYWHIMLIQVKSSQNSNSIYKLNSSEIKMFNEFAKFLKLQINSSSALKDYHKKSIVISTGYAGVYINKKNNKRILKNTEYFNSFRKNMGKIDKISVELKLRISHGFYPKK